MEENFLITNINRLIKKKGWIDIPSSGVSMYPLIKEGDVCRFIPIKSDNFFKKGEIILYISDEGQLVGHRYIQSIFEKSILYHVMKGDTNVFWDQPVENSQIIGKLEIIKKKKIHLRTQGIISKLWGSIVFALPALPRYCKHYLSLKRRLRIKSVL
jgi:signal peptidase I